MKKLLFLCAAAAFVFSSCSDDDNAGNGGDNGSDDIRTIFVKTGDISNLPASTTIDQVSFFVYYNDGDSKHALVTGKWQNGFTFTLPATVSSTYLTRISTMLELDDVTHTVSISNTSAMVTEMTEFIPYNNNTAVGEIAVTGNDGNWNVWYLYSDRDVNVKGTYTDTEAKEQYIYDLELKKGWNRVAQGDGPEQVNGETYEVTRIKTDLPSKLHWIYYNE